MNNVTTIAALIVILYSPQSLLASAQISTNTVGSEISKLKEYNLTDEFNKIFLSANEVGEENKLVKAQWGGNCTAKHWERCRELAGYLKMWGSEIQEKDRPTSPKYIHHVNNGKLNCTNETELALKCFNKTWTVSRCHILCMSFCNRDLRKYSKYDKLYKDGPCVIDGVDTSLFPMEMGWNSNTRGNLTEMEEDTNGISHILHATSSFLLPTFLIIFSQIS